MVKDISWHQNCLKNQRLNLERKLAELERIKKEYTKDYNNYIFYEDQIREAIKKRKDSFDSERFMANKRPQ